MPYLAKMASIGVILMGLIVNASAQTQSIVTSSITIKNTTTGPYAASVNTNGSNGGCTATIGSGVAACSGFSQVNTSIPVNGQISGTASYQASNAYNTLYQANLTFYLSTLDPGINTQSTSSCSWQIQVIRQTSQFGKPWQDTVSYSGTHDTNTPLIPSCSYSNFSVNSSTGQYSIILTFSGS